LIPTNTPETVGGDLQTFVTPNPDQAEFTVRLEPFNTGTQIAAEFKERTRHTYLIRAGADQHILVDTLEWDHALTVNLYTPGGALLFPESDFGDHHVWRLPSNQEYRLEIRSSETGVDYRFSLQIPRVIRFPQGSFGTSEDGSLSAGAPVLYQLRAAPGQTMTVRVTPESGEIEVEVFELLSGDVVEDDLSAPGEWRGRLTPGESHYIVSLTTDSGGEVDYEISFDIR
jgi:hypothetical protein